jgi:hypothetical protein
VAFLTQLTVTRHIDPKTKARVPANTPGAKKVKEKTDCYYIVDKSGGQVKRINTECTDFRAAQAALTKYRTAQERGYALGESRCSCRNASSPLIARDQRVRVSLLLTSTEAAMSSWRAGRGRG